MTTLHTLAPGAAMPLDDFGYRRILRLVAESASRQQPGPADDEYERTRKLADRQRRLRELQDEFG